VKLSSSKHLQEEILLYVLYITDVIHTVSFIQLEKSVSNKWTKLNRNSNYASASSDFNMSINNSACKLKFRAHAKHSCRISCSKFREIIRLHER
jgi:hypothetical protein